MSNYCQGFKDANNLQTIKSDASSVVFLLGKVCRENSFLFSPLFSCQDKAVLFLPPAFSLSLPSLRDWSFFCSPPYKATTTNMTFSQQKSLSVNRCAAFIPHFCFAGLAWMGIAKDSKRTPSSRAPMRTVSHCQHPTVWLCQSTLSSSDGNTRNLPALSRQSTGLAIPVKG